MMGLSVCISVGILLGWHTYLVLSNQVLNAPVNHPFCLLNIVHRQPSSSMRTRTAYTVRL
jgi:hypothetical protein